MPPFRRIALLAFTTLAGLATVPTRGEDAHLERPKPRVTLGAADRWRLRPAQGAVPSPATTGSLAARPTTAIPEARRNVRLVYPALVEAR